MKVGVPREVKSGEDRVAITPAGVHALVRNGHQVLLESGAGDGSRISDAEYHAAGALLATSPEQVWAQADMVLKVKEPVLSEFCLMRPDQVLFAYLHLAADEDLLVELLKRKVTAVAFETVELADGSLPLLAPMSDIAGRMAALVGCHALLRSQGGRGVLFGGVTGVQPARVVVLGAGRAGMGAASVALGLQSAVQLLDRDVNRLRAANTAFSGRCETIESSAFAVERAVLAADLVIGAVLVPGAKAPRLVSNDLVSRMLPGSVLVDVSIDQGGCFEDSRPTTHEAPTYPVHGSTFYCVANIPGAVPRTSTYALAQVTLPYVLQIADRGWKAALTSNPELRSGLQTDQGRLFNRAVGSAHSMTVSAWDAAIAR